MTVYITGDIHGMPVDRDWPTAEEAEAVIIAGDFGIPFGLLSPNHTIAEAQRELKYAHFLNDLGYPIYALCGNHDDRDAYGAMDTIWLGQYPARQFGMYGEIFDNIYIIDRPWAGEIGDQKFLLIPGAACHDLFYKPGEPSDPADMERYYNHVWHYDFIRCNHRSWWENEDVDLTGVTHVLGTMEFRPDVIVSHDAPAHIAAPYNQEYLTMRDKTTKGQDILEKVYKRFPHVPWIHGHFHRNTFENLKEDAPVRCVYNDFVYVENGEINSKLFWSVNEND